MKEHRTVPLLTVILFCGFLGLMGVLYVLLPKSEFSDLEKRYLAEPPAFSFQTLANGGWGEEAETYLADHMPGRDFFVGLNAYFEKFTGRQKTKEIWCYEDFLLEAPNPMDEAAIRRNTEAVNGFAQEISCPVDLMLIPSTGYFCGLPQYEDSRILDAIRENMLEEIHTVDLRQILSPECFYRTDHHWNSLGAFRGYEAYVSSLGLTPRTDFRQETYGPFHGSTYARSGLWLTAGEEITLYRGSKNLTAWNGEDRQDHPGVFYEENLQKSDKYTVFLGGNHSRVTVKNPGQTGKLLVIRDSFSNCLGCFLPESFGEVTLVDLRYDKQSVKALVEEGEYDRVLVCYGLKNFLTDQNLIFLGR